jgi:hypothetical protein
MKAQDYPIAHFEFMLRLVEALEGVPSQLLEHNYSSQSFGSWTMSVRYTGNIVNLCYDGKESSLSVRYSSDRKPPYRFGTEVDVELTESDPARTSDIVRRICERISAPPSSWPQGAA